MTYGEENGDRLLTFDTAALAVPGADGRWQPTRAGVVNSWAWADETLLFADGLLALAGPNGSGKSLTASMLVTVLLDAETSQTALSVSGKASGTLTSRHTDRNEREDRTGAWWLEYGQREASTGQIAYLTTGLWLRSTSSELQRAFFIAPGRIGHDLVLRRDREAVRVADLAAQLAAIDGELFTSSAKLRSHVTAHLQTVGDERDFRQTIRTRLFAPLDEVQFDALLGVLRSLRSVRTAEAISPSKMREVLTEALPALEPDQLKLIAEAMERIAELENQLDRARTEARLLSDAHRAYGRYLITIAQLQAAELASANNAYDDQTRRAKEATEKLEAAQAAKSSAETRLSTIRTTVSQLEGEVSAADTALRNHAGAELPLLEKRADELTETANDAEERARQAAENAREAAEQAQESREAALKVQRHLNDLTDGLQRESTTLGAEAAFNNLFAALRDVVTREPHSPPPSLDLAQLRATPYAWAEARTKQIRRVHDALQQHSDAQRNAAAIAASRREAEDAESAARDLLEESTRTRRQAESVLLDRLSAWSATLQQLTYPPSELDTPESESADERISTEALTTWIRSAAAEARDRIDLIGCQQQAQTDAALAKAARERATDARAAHSAAVGQANDVGRRFDEISAETEAKTEAADRQRHHAYRSHAETLDAIQSTVTAARQRHSDGAAAAVLAARGWLTAAHRWRDSLRFLAADAIGLPGRADQLASGELNALNPDDLRLSAHRAYAIAVTDLHHRVAGAREQVQQVADRIDAVEADLAQARQEAPVPDAPAWRDRRPQDGVALWALVDFADHLSTEDADRLEGALLVSGLLDALVTPDGRLSVGDLVITARTPASGRTLYDLLRPERHPDLSEEQITQVLRAIPLDASAAGLGLGVLTNGALTASCPPGYRAAYIGRTARERARQERVADLENQLARLETELAVAQNDLRARERDVTAAAAERDSLPPTDELLATREEVARLTEQFTAAERQAAHDTAQADRALQAIVDALNTEAAQRATQLAEAKAELRHAQQIAATADERATKAEEEAAELALTAADSEAARAEAASAQSEADAERSRFPDALIATVATAHEDEDRAEEVLTQARVSVIDLSEGHRNATDLLKGALRALNQAATLPDGSLLPTARDPLDDYLAAVSSLARGIDGCSAAAERCSDLLGHAHQAQRNAATMRGTASRAAETATKASLAATNALANVQKIRELHGVEYQDLLQTRRALADRLQAARNEEKELINERQIAGERAAAAESTLKGIAPQRAEAERRRDRSLRLLGRLIDERLATLPEDLPADPSGRPANLTAGLTWSRRLLADKPAGSERLNALTQNRNRALTTLEKSVRTASTALARFNRQVILLTIEDTEWRRAVIAEPDASRGEDLDLALQALNTSIAQLEGDLRDDVKQTLKTGMFTKLRRDIQIRREAARELVRHIRATLREVRTGVANVGVQVDWDVRDDKDAQSMIDLISQNPSDETFEQMYTVLRQRMDETVGEPWPDRVAHTFDYRSWHEWDISVTHSSFGDGTTEVFRKVSPRSNPLESLSTGERRLATMLPLLAAAWSMYSGDTYRGPRLLSIDEIDAAFDEPNLRQVLGLLRSWQFDVLATTPSISPMIKREAGRVMVHEVIAAGRQRITVPWLWEGQGEPQPLTLKLDASP